MKEQCGVLKLYKIRFGLIIEVKEVTSCDLGDKKEFLRQKYNSVVGRETANAKTYGMREHYKPKGLRQGQCE